MEFVEPRRIRLAVRHALERDCAKDLAGKRLLARIFFNIRSGRRPAKIIAQPLAIDACRQQHACGERKGDKNDSHD
jgi:hypothetical protein